MKCKCGYEVNENMKFCPECGEKIVSQKSPSQVPETAEIVPLPPVLNSNDVCELFSISKNMLYELCWQKKIPHIRIGKKYAFRSKEILEWAGTKEKISTAG